MNTQVEGYRSNRGKESILTHWLHTTKSPGSTLPSGHLRRRQNKYLQLSSSLFGDQDERDKIRQYREIENQDKLRRQLTEVKLHENLQKDEDDRVFRAMGIPVAPRRNTGINLDSSFIKRDKTPAPKSSYSHQTLSLDYTTRKRDKTPAPKSSNTFHQSSRLKPETSQPSRQPRSQPSRSPSNYLPKTSHSYPQSNREKRGNYEPSFGQTRSRSRAPQGGNFSHLLKRSHSFDFAPTAGGQRDKFQGNSRRRDQGLKGPVAYLPGKDGRLIPYVPLLYPSTADYFHQNPLSSRRSTSFPTVNLPKGSHGLPLAYVPVSREHRQMWQAFNPDHIYVPTEREREQERQQFLRQQISEKNFLNDQRRQKELRDDQIIEQNVLRQREKIRLEYEAERAKEASKEQLAAQKRLAQTQKIEALKKQAEEDKKKKFAQYRRNTPHPRATTSNEIPKIIVDPIEDNREIRPSKKTKKKATVKSSSSKPKKKKKKISAKKTLPKLNIKSERMNSRELSRTGFSPGKSSSSNNDKNSSSRRRYPEKDLLDLESTEINMQEKNWKRRRLPSKGSNGNDFGLRVPSKSLVVNDQTLTSTVFDETIRRRKKPNSNLKRLKKESGEVMGPRSAPLPPIRKTKGEEKRPATDPTPQSKAELGIQTDYEIKSRYTPERRVVSAGIQAHDSDKEEPEEKPKKDQEEEPQKVNETPEKKLEKETRKTPPPQSTQPFDWRIVLEDDEDEEEMKKMKEESEQRLQKFGKKKGLMRQLTALKRGIQDPNAELDDDDDDDDDDEKKSEETKKEEDGIPEEDFSRKLSLGDGHKVDLDGTNKTVLRNFLNRFSKKKDDEEEETAKGEETERDSEQKEQIKKQLEESQKLDLEKTNKTLLQSFLDKLSRKKTH